MVQYKSFDTSVEVNGETVSTIINAFPEYLTEFAALYEILQICNSFYSIKFRIEFICTGRLAKIILF